MTDSSNELIRLQGNDSEVMRIWRECGLPEHFLGNGGTNGKLVEFAKRTAQAQVETLTFELSSAKAEHGKTLLLAQKAIGEVETLTQELAGMRTSYKAALREIDRLHNQPDEVKP